MSLVDKLYQTVEGVFAWISWAIKQDALSYCDLETADSRYNLVSKDGSLLSVISLQGYRRFVGANEFAYLCEKISEMLQPPFSQSGHFLQFYFAHDNTYVDQSIEKMLTPAKRTAKRIGLDIDDIFDSKVDVLSDFCANEDCFLVIWTTQACLERSHLKRAIKTEQEKLKAYKLPRVPNTQDLFAVLPELRNIHDSLIGTILEDLQHAGFYCRLLDVHEAVYHTRKSNAEPVTDPTWRPFLPGDKLPLHLNQKDKPDLASLLWPSLDQQIIPEEGENVGLKYCRIGTQIFAPIFIELFPKDIKPFYELFRRLLPTKMPWRISYYVAPDGVSVTKSKAALAQFLTFSSSHNKLIVDSNALLKTLHERSDDPIIKYFVCLTTWTEEGKLDQLKGQAARLVKAVQSWGGCEVRDVSGDSFATTMAGAVAMTKKLNFTASAAPLSEAVYMMPFVRPASPWQSGAMLFRTPDGKLWPYQPGSNHQVSWIDIIYARSGSGKSVLINTLNLGLCLLQGLSQLPRIGIIDIGPSSKGFISLLKEGLAEEKREQVRYHRLTLNEEDAINPFDTQLGARYPTKLHRSFIINFLSLLLVDHVEDKPYEGMAGMLSMIVDETFKRFSDKEQPKLYVKGSNPIIDTGLQKHGLFQTEEQNITWWQVVDALFEKDEKELADIAQRYAVPTVADTVALANAYSIKDLYGEVTSPTGEDYVTAYSRIISSVIRNFPTLTSITRLSFSKARIIALDLDEVAKTGSAAADKQTAIMYMLSRHLLAKDFFIHSDEIEKMPQIYWHFHKSRIKELMEEPKRLVMDEFHRTSKSPAIRAQVLQDMREGRKWKIHIALASQSIKDFDSLMVEFATSIFILDSGSSATVDETCRIFGLTDTERVALTTRVHGPTSVGATFIAQFVTKKGLNTQLLTSTISPVELWAFNTTTEDVRIREALYQEIGPKAARQMLAVHFPKGSATDEIDAKVKNDPSLTVGDVCEEFTQMLITHYRKQQRRKQRFDIETDFL